MTDSPAPVIVDTARRYVHLRMTIEEKVRCKKVLFSEASKTIISDGG